MLIPPAPLAPLTLNVDLGELPDEPEALYVLATVANVACGGHAGDAGSMRRACALAKVHGCSVAAHPSYPDRPGFGRRSLEIAPAALRETIAAQCRALAEAARGAGVVVATVKPHGALYHDVSRDPAIAEAVLDGVEEALEHRPLALVVPSEDGALAALARARGHRVVREGFADRGYAADGSLLSRAAPGALLSEPHAAAAQALALARSGRFDTLCVHGDGPHAVAIAEAVRAALAAEGALR
jgi:UPF0271 protein